MHLEFSLYYFISDLEKHSEQL